MSRTINHEKLLEIRKKLKSLPKAVRIKVYSGPEALNELKDDILALTDKGYNPKEIAKILKETGLAVSVTKVKKILTPETPPTDDTPEVDQSEQPQQTDDTSEMERSKRLEMLDDTPELEQSEQPQQTDDTPEMEQPEQPQQIDDPPEVEQSEQTEQELQMTDEQKEMMKASAQAVERQVQESPDLGIPVDPDVADYMGAFSEKAITPDDLDDLGVDEGGAVHG